LYSYWDNCLFVLVSSNTIPISPLYSIIFNHAVTYNSKVASNKLSNNLMLLHLSFLHPFAQYLQYKVQYTTTTLSRTWAFGNYLYSFHCLFDDDNDDDDGMNGIGKSPWSRIKLYKTAAKHFYPFVNMRSFMINAFPPINTIA